LVGFALVAVACSTGTDQTSSPTTELGDKETTLASTLAPDPAGLSNNPASWTLAAIGPNAVAGDTVVLADYVGKPLVVTFFGADEDSDRDLAAKLLVAQEAGDEVVFIGIAIGDADQISDSIERTGIGQWVLATDFDNNGLLAAMSGTQIPSTAFYDAAGEYLGIQAAPFDRPTMQSALFRLFGIGEAPPAAPSDYAGFRAQPTACGNAQPDPVEILTFDAPQAQALTGTITAVLSTSCGDIELSLDADTYPETVNSFVFLARAGFYDGIVCHRLVPGFVLQCGDQTATGTSGPGYTVPDEFPEDGFVYEQGVVAMANAGAGTTGSQFFIVIGDGSFLDNTFSILGTVVGSADALAALTEVPLGISARGEASVPLETVYLNTLEISE